MPTQTTGIQAAFNALAQDRQLDIIYHGAALRLNDLQKRYFLAKYAPMKSDTRQV